MVSSARICYRLQQTLRSSPKPALLWGPLSSTHRRRACGLRKLEPVDVTDVQIEQPTAFVQPAVNGAEPEEQAKPATGSMILFESVTKVYEPDVTALNSVNFAIDKGEFVFVVGASGSGKTTLVRLLLKELEPSDGRVIIGGRDIGRLRHAHVPRLRRNIGCVFQDFKLLPSRTAAENVAYALKVQGELRGDLLDALAIVSN